MLSIRRIPKPAIQRIPNHRPPAHRGSRRPESQTASLDLVIQIEERHARLDDRVAEFTVHLEDPVHPPEVQDYTAWDNGFGAAVAWAVSVVHGVG